MTDDSSWLLVDFEVDDVSAPVVADVLWTLGVAAIEEISGDAGSLVLRTSLGDDAAAAIEEVVERFPHITAHLVEIPRSVSDTWRDHVEPTHVVDDVWLVPAWHASRPGRSILVEPFDTFGLGNHPTTVLTLRSALPLVTADSRVLDLGSGSGVLSVALASIVGAHVDAHDIAAQGEAALHHNARLNRVESLVSWRDALGVRDDGNYDVVMANILAPVLRELAPMIERAVRPGGHMILSGLREDQEGTVLAAFHGSVQTTVVHMDGWSALTLRREM